MALSPGMLILAAKASRLVATASRESESYRIAGRLARDPDDLDTLSQSIVHEAKRESLPFAQLMNTLQGFVILQFALERVSTLCWESLWNKAHPDRFGQAWEGEDSALMSEWRKRVRAVIKECHQEFILVMHADEYIAMLTYAGVDGETAGELAGWLSQVVCETTDAA